WMMGDTGPCGPCSEIHVDLTPAGDTKGSLVNKGDARCIEIWNLVFIQFNANPDGTFTPLPAKHVDTGMGFERVTSIMQGTKGFKDFANAKISNYETDIFRPIFDEIEKMSGKKYGSTLPPRTAGDAKAQIAEIVSAIPFGKVMTYGDVGKTCRPPIEFGPAVASSIKSQQSDIPWHRVVGDAGVLSVEKLSERQASEQQTLLRREGVQFVADGKVELTSSRITHEQFSHDIAFRVIADHIRTLSFAISDGILPANTDRNYVLRRILRRAVRYGRTLAFHEPFFYKLVDVLAMTMGDVFPEIRSKQQHVKDVLKTEEEAFNKTLDTGIKRFETYASSASTLCEGRDIKGQQKPPTIFGEWAFELYDTYGFPFDLTELMARERGLAVDTAGFQKLMEEQRARARAAQKKQVIEINRYLPPTKFVGYDRLEAECLVIGFESIVRNDGGKDEYVIVNESPLYAEMGGQIGDRGLLERRNTLSRGVAARVVDTVKKGESFLLKLDPAQLDDLDRAGFFAHEAPEDRAILKVDADRRNAIQRHHTVTHLFHWALHEVVSHDASQKGSYVGPDKLTFDFNSAPLTPQQIADIEKLVNERIVENAGVSWSEVPYADVKSRKDVMQFFGDKYGDTVRVVQIGGRAGELDGYSMELCGGTHTRATGEIGLFRIVGESAIAAGVRRIEAVAGLEAYRRANEELQLIKSLAGKVNAPLHELDKKIDALLAHQKELEKQLKTAVQRNASNAASELLGRAQSVNNIPLITHNLGDAEADFLQAVADALKGRFKGVVVLGGGNNAAVTLVASVTPEFTKQVQAGKIIQAIAPIVGGKGGGRPDNARGGGKDASKLDEALAKVRSLLG
ncbi:MAG: alanine--tRNA ligase, partial [Verrucomicrobiota bacterium]